MTTTFVDSKQLFSGLCAILSHCGCIGACTGRCKCNVLEPGAQLSAIVKAGAVITVVITSYTCC